MTLTAIVTHSPRSSLSVQLVFFCHCGARTPFTTHGKAIFLCSRGLAPFTTAFNQTGNSLQFFAHPNLSSSWCASLKSRFFPSIETATSHRTCELSCACPICDPLLCLSLMGFSASGTVLSLPAALFLGSVLCIFLSLLEHLGACQISTISKYLL